MSAPGPPRQGVPTTIVVKRLSKAGNEAVRQVAGELAGGGPARSGFAEAASDLVRPLYAPATRIQDGTLRPRNKRPSPLNIGVEHKAAVTERRPTVTAATSGAPATIDPCRNLVPKRFALRFTTTRESTFHNKPCPRMHPRAPFSTPCRQAEQLRKGNFCREPTPGLEPGTPSLRVKCSTS